MENHMNKKADHSLIYSLQDVLKFIHPNRRAPIVHDIPIDP